MNFQPTFVSNINVKVQDFPSGAVAAPHRAQRVTSLLLFSFKCFLVAVMISSLPRVLRRYVWKFPSVGISAFFILVKDLQQLHCGPFTKSMWWQFLKSAGTWFNGLAHGEFVFYVYIEIMGIFITLYDSLMRVSFPLHDFKYAGRCYAVLFGVWHAIGIMGVRSLCPSKPTFPAPPSSMSQQGGICGLHLLLWDFHLGSAALVGVWIVVRKERLGNFLH